jgi:uncharacterized protein YcbX
MPIITHLYRYPIKGLNPEILQRVSLQAGKEISLDRRFALAHKTTEFDPHAPQHLHKTRFLMQMKNERLAALNAVYDDNTDILQIFKDNKLFAKGNLQTTQGRQTIENFFADYFSDEIHDTPKLIEAPGHTFSDVNAKVLSCINLATVRELEKVLGTIVHSLRFRANVYFDDAQPWAELDWVDKKLMLGTAKVRVLKLTERCAATNVNPHTAKRDLKIPQALLKTYGHRHLGIYVQVIENGKVAVGDKLQVETRG